MQEQATFAGGCFWCIQGPYDAQEGVSDVRVGYAGGSEEDADYMKVASHQTQHRESVTMHFDPSVVSYRTLVEIFFRQIDPTDPGGQFADRGHQYTTAVYVHNDDQRAVVHEYITELNNSGKFDASVATVIEPFTTFFDAEEEHQAYYKKNPLRYGMYKRGSGRAEYISKHWKK